MTLAVCFVHVLTRSLLPVVLLLPALGCEPSSGLDLDATIGPQATIPLCLDCLRLSNWVPPDDPPPVDPRATLYVVYDQQEPECAAALSDVLSAFGADGVDALIPEHVYLGMRFDDGPFVWNSVTLALENGPGPDDGVRWAITLDAEQLRPFIGEPGQPEIELRGPCNGRDDNCDDDEDGDIITACGEGECAAFGALRCPDGAEPGAARIVEECRPLEPSFEICDGLDNDCDGAVDAGQCFDGPLSALLDDQGMEMQCQVGALSCVDGREVCEGQVPPGLEVPDRGLAASDEDCDGRIDDFAMSCADCPSGSVAIESLGRPDPERVIVSVGLPANLDRADLDARALEIEAVVQRMTAEFAAIAANEPGSFRLVRRFRWVPAFVAEVDGAMLEHIVRHDDAVRVTRDTPFELALADASARIGAVAARQESSATGRGVRIAVLDTGVELRHAAFGRCGRPGDPACAIVAGYDAVDDDDDPSDDRPHGTDIAQIIAGRAAPGMSPGIAPDAELVVLRVVGDDGRAAMSGILAALDWLIGRPELQVGVINMSLQTRESFTPATCAVAGDALESTFAELRRGGAFIAAAAGNSGDPRRLSLGACGPSVAAVGATYARDAIGARAYPEAGCEDPLAVLDAIPCFSSGRAAWPPFVGLMAPGDVVLQRGGEAGAPAVGTSVSSAFVAGAAAALLSARPDSTPDTVLETLFATGVPVGAAGVLRRVDVRAATARACPDGDGDGAGAGPDCPQPDDCDDRDPARAPHLEEQLGGNDEDCDGTVDEADACQMLWVLETGLIPACNMLRGIPEELEMCLAEGPGPCEDMETLAAWCTRHVPGRHDDWLEIQLPVMEARYPDACLRWAPVRDTDGVRRMHCVAFEAGICQASILAFD